jgi:predicted  nucleic acid-binding Zn-ribbon protein
MTDQPRGLSHLLKLQEVDSSLDRLRARRSALEGGAEVEAAREQLRSAETVAGELRLSIDDVSQTVRRLEGDADGFQQKLSAEERRMFDGSVANPKELESIQAEVTNLRNRKSRVEDEVLENMERREELEAQLTRAEEAVQTGRAGLSALLGESEEELQQIEKDVARLEAERGVLAPEFDEELLELYEDLRRQKKGVGAAALVDGVCQGCHQQLSPVALDRLRRTDGVRRCEHCRRILVF